MKITTVPIASLKRPEKNVRVHTPKQLSEFVRSVKKFGQIRPIVCDEDYVMLAGNGLYDALIECGFETAECYVVSGLSDNDKKKLMLADNKIFSLGVDDISAFEEILAELSGDFDIPGYDDELLKVLSADVAEADDFMSGYGSINTETMDYMQKSGEKYAREDAEFSENAVELPIQPQETARSSVSPTENIPTSQAKTPEENKIQPLQRRFVLCPKCGERIWL